MLLADTTVNAYVQQTDQQLAALVSQGDREAFAALYKRYFQGVYDFAARVSRNQDIAADVVQSTFVKAWRQLQERHAPSNLKAWLFTVARNAAIDELRYDNRLVAQGDDDGSRSEFEFTLVDPSRLNNPQATLEDKELIELVWESAAALRPQEYTLLDLHLRQGLSTDELAENLGVSKGTLYTKLSRLRAALEESVVATLLLRRGRHDCPDLNGLLIQLEATEVTRQVRWAVQAHLRDCERCQDSKRRYASPATILGALAPVPATPGVRDLLWLQISDQLNRDLPSAGKSALQAVQSKPKLASPLMVIVPAVLLLTLTLGAVGALAWWLAPTVEDPDDVHSPSHAIGQTSDDNTVEVAWSPQSGVAAYSVLWSQGDQDLPDATPDLPGTATGATSPALPDGLWYFHMRTQGDNGDWTSTVHLGPFSILGPPSTLTPTVTIVVTTTPDLPDSVIITETPFIPVETPTETPIVPTDDPTETPVTPTATSTQTPLPTNTPTFTPTPTPTFTPSPTSTFTPTPTFTPSPTPNIHYTTDYVFNPGSPAELISGQDVVNLTFKYVTTKPEGVKFALVLFSNGVLSPNQFVPESPLYPFTGADNAGLANLTFSITAGEVQVNEVRLQLWSADKSQFLSETPLAVNYSFSDPEVEFHEVTITGLNPASPKVLYVDEQVDITYEYTTTEEGGVRIFIEPFSDGSQDFQYQTSNVPVQPVGDGNDTVWFSVSENKSIDQLRVRMVAADDESQILFEDDMTVYYNFANFLIDLE